jgi:broad specificity phosphatase PhoE
VNDVFTRADKLLKSIITEYHDKTILLSSHGFIGKIIVGILQHKNWKEISAGASLRNTSLTIFEIRKEENIPILIDSTDHLQQ